MPDLKKHVAIITTSYPEQEDKLGPSAAGVFVVDFAHHLANYVRVTVVAPSRKEFRNDLFGLPTHFFKVPVLPLSLLKPGNPGDWIKILKTVRAGSKALEKLSKIEPVDHILALWILPSGHWARRVKKKHGVPYSTWALGSDIWTLAPIPVVRQYMGMVLRSAHSRFADGLDICDHVRTIGGADCQFLPTTRALSFASVKELAVKPPYKLAFLGRWHATKGPDILIQALADLPPADWERIAEFQICGGGPMEDIVKAGCHAMKAAGRPVTLRGYLEKREVEELIAWADYLVLPSRVESIPVIFSEAMQGRCPLIATPAGDLPRLIKDFDVGVTASGVSAAALGRAIHDALNRPPASYSEGLERVLEQFDLKRAAARFLRQTGLLE